MMNRRRFTYLSGLALPASFLPLRSALSKLEKNVLQPVVQEHLQSFKKELAKGLTHHVSTEHLVHQMTSVQRIQTLTYKDKQEYTLVFNNLAGNVIRLECKKGVKRVLVS